MSAEQAARGHVAHRHSSTGLWATGKAECESKLWERSAEEGGGCLASLWTPQAQGTVSKGPELWERVVSLGAASRVHCRKQLGVKLQPQVGALWSKALNAHQVTCTSYIFLIVLQDT